MKAPLRDLSQIPYMRFAKDPARFCPLMMTGSAAPPVDWSELGYDPSYLELYQYSPYGDPELLGRIAEYGGVSEDHVFLASSVTHAHFCVGASVLGPGDHVLCERPGYTPVFDALTVVGAEISLFERSRSRDYGLPPATDLIVAAERVEAKAICVSELHNPTGVGLTDRDRQTLVDIASYGIVVLLDETYRPFRTPDPGTQHLAHPNIVAFEGLNKVHGLPQIRIGWAYATPEFVDRARCVMDATTVHTSCLSDQVARFALTRVDALRDRATGLAEAGWSKVEPWLESRGFDFVAPDGGYTVFPKPPSGVDAADFIERAYEVGVGLTPGVHFGDSERFRMGFGRFDEIDAALAALDGILSK